VISWTSADGTRLRESFTSRPASIQGKIPVAGGDSWRADGADQPIVNADRYYPIERFVAKGALVLKRITAVRRLRRKIPRAERAQSRRRDYADVISGVDALIAKGWVDKDRWLDGLEPGRIHFGVHHGIEQPVQGVSVAREFPTG